MIFEPLAIEDAFLVRLEEGVDARGFYARAYCRQEFEAHGITPPVEQMNLVGTRVAGTVRGLHYQESPYEEAKYIRCIAGAVYDVLVDMRPESPSFLAVAQVELSAENRLAVYVPARCAHGFQSLVDDSQVIYQVGGVYCAEAERGVRPNDPALKIDWPLPIKKLSEKDSSWPLL